MTRRSGAVSSDATAGETADQLLLGDHSAVAAVVGGFFAAAGQRPGVLFGPVTLLLAAVGTGTRVLDGRLRQPGLGTRRPRGFRPEDPIPDAARVAAPTSIAALLVALTYDDAYRLKAVLEPGIQLAKKVGSLPRASLLGRIGEMGARALSESRVARPLIAVAGPAEGGLLTPEDLQPSTDLDLAASVVGTADGVMVAPPWLQEDPAIAGSQNHTLVALDARGFAAVLCYTEALSGVIVPELETLLLPTAEPVRRGVTRMAAGTALAAPAPAAIWSVSGTPVEARGDTVTRPPERLRYGLTRDARSRRVHPIRAARD